MYNSLIYMVSSDYFDCTILTFSFAWFKLCACLFNLLVQESTGKCEALYEFEGEGDGELSFVPGEMITTLESVDADWMKGRIGSREGIFPVAFVKVISEITKAPQVDKKSINLKSNSSSTYES